MRHLYIVRHGETDFNKTQKIQGRGIDAPLNLTGKSQAKAVAAYFKEIPVSRVVTSSLRRTVETAGPLLRLTDAAFESHPELDEMNYGEYEGLPFQQVMHEIKQMNANWASGNLDDRPLYGESPKEVYERAHAKVLDVLTRTDDEHLVFVIHGRLIRILLSEWLGYGLVNMDKIAHANGAINYLSKAGGEFTPVSLNITTHLTELVL